MIPCKFGFTKPLLNEILKQTSGLAEKPIDVKDIEIIVATSTGFRVHLMSGDCYFLKYGIA